MKDTQKAFHWILDILERRKITYRISGGLAARVYGSKRELADIDIEVADKNIRLISEDVGPHIIFGPARYRDDNWDLNLMTLNYQGQEIDIAGIEAKIFNQKTGQWEYLASDLSDFEMREVFGKVVPLEPLNFLIEYKQKLAREVDLDDVRQLKSGQKSRIISCKSRFGGKYLGKI